LTIFQHPKTDSKQSLECKSLSTYRVSQLVSPTERSIQLGCMLDQAHKHKVGANNHNFTKREERYYYNKATLTQRKFPKRRFPGSGEY
jgi:hypothetical protein